MRLDGKAVGAMTSKSKHLQRASMASLALDGGPLDVAVAGPVKS